LGVRKSAILLLSLPPQQAEAILSRLPADAIAAVQREMASLRRIPVSERTAVFDEYRRQLSAQTSSLPDPLEGCSPDGIVAAVHDEHPQTIAALLASLPVSKAGDCLTRLPIRTQIEVVRRLASLRPIDDALLDDVHSSIRAQVQRQPAGTALSRVQESSEQNPATASSKTSSAWTKPACAWCWRKSTTTRLPWRSAPPAAASAAMCLAR
jgi:flagellar motor switch protein FliG